MGTSAGPVESQPGSTPDRFAQGTPRPGGSLRAGVVLGIALGLLAPLAAMSLHIGGLFGGIGGLYPLVLAELIIPIAVWLVVAVVLVTRPSLRRKGTGVLVGGAIPAVLLLWTLLPILVPGALENRGAEPTDFRDCTTDEAAMIRELLPQDGQITALVGSDACYATIATAVASADWRAHYEGEFRDHGWQKVTPGPGRDDEVISAVRNGFSVDVRPGQSQDSGRAIYVELRGR